MPHLDKQLAAARTDLAAAETSLAAILSGEDAAAGTSKAYSEWRSAKADAEVEIARLGRFITKLTADVDAVAKEKAATEQAALEAAADEAAEAAKLLIVEKLELMHAAVREIMTAIASSDAKIAVANRGRRPDLPPLEGAELRARRGEKLERHNISERVFEAWCYPHERRPLGPDQDALVSGSGNRGRLRSESGTAEVTRRRFREIRFLPEFAAQIPDPLASTLNIPPVRGGDAPGWSPIQFATSGTILQQIDSFAAMDAEPDRRRPQIEIQCLGDAEQSVAA